MDSAWLVPFAINSLYGKADALDKILPADNSEATFVENLPTPSVLAYINRAQAGKPKALLA